MRQWIENLAEISKKEGLNREGYSCEIKDIRWSVISWPEYYTIDIKLIKENRNTSIKIYEDEYDLLKSVINYLNEENQDYIIEKLNNLQ